MNQKMLQMGVVAKKEKNNNRGVERRAASERLPAHQSVLRHTEFSQDSMHTYSLEVVPSIGIRSVSFQTHEQDCSHVWKRMHTELNP